MTPQELHEQVMTALSKCPQYRPWPYTAKPWHYPKYDTLEAVVRFWLHDKTLWDKGYADCLPKKAQELFIKVRCAQSQAVVTAVADYLKGE